MKPFIMLLVVMISSLAHSTSDSLCLTINEALSIARKHNLSISQAGEEINAAKAGYNQAKTEFLPALNASSTYTAYPDEDMGEGLMTRGGGSHQTGLNANWTIWQGGMRFANLSVQNSSKNLAESESKNTTELVLNTTINAYLDLLEATRFLAVAKSSLDLAIETQEQTEGLIAAGKATASDMLRARVSVSREKGTLILAQNTMDNAQRDLCDILNLPKREIVPVEPAFIEIDMNNVDTMNAQVTHTPLFDMAASHLGMSEAKIRLIKAQFQPTFSLFGSYNWSGENYDFVESDYSGGLRISWSLFEGGSRHYELQAAKADERSARFGLKSTEREVANAIDSDKRVIRNTIAGWQTARQTVEFAKESYEQIDAMYKLGHSTSLELFTAQETLNESRLDEIKAFYAIYRSYTRLLMDTGRLDATIADNGLFLRSDD